MILAARSAVVRLRALRAIENSGIPGNLLAAVMLDFPVLSDLILRLRKPVSFPNKIAARPGLACEIFTK